LVFVDHGPDPADRGQAVLELMDRTDVFVFHDTEDVDSSGGGLRFEYGWDKVLPLFRYSYTDTMYPVHTTIVSNLIDVGDSRWLQH
jgi:hypothetical protein